MGTWRRGRPRLFEGERTGGADPSRMGRAGFVLPPALRTWWSSGDPILVLTVHSSGRAVGRRAARGGPSCGGSERNSPPADGPRAGVAHREGASSGCTHSRLPRGGGLTVATHKGPRTAAQGGGVRREWVAGVVPSGRATSDDPPPFRSPCAEVLGACRRRGGVGAPRGTSTSRATRSRGARLRGDCP